MFSHIIELTVQGIELVAVAILALGVAFVLIRAVVSLVGGTSMMSVYSTIREGLGRVLLVGLEVLIAADIIATVALELSIRNITALGLVVLIRTFLSWAIEVEADGHWPWQAARHRADNNQADNNQADNNHGDNSDGEEVDSRARSATAGEGIAGAGRT